MHKLILILFKKIRDLEKFLRLVIIFLIMLMALYWFQNLLGANWKLLGFIKPFLDWILDLSDSIYSLSFDFWGKTMELKYFVAVTIMFIAAMSLNIISFTLEFLENLYDDIHRKCQKANEEAFNYALQKAVDIPEKQQSKFMVYIQTKVVTRHNVPIKGFDINEQNVLMNKFITSRTNTIPTDIWEGYLYTFNNIENLDKILDVLYKIKHSEAPMSYLICIQVGNDMEQLKKLASLQYWDKIIIAADTLYRYNLNNLHNYETSNLGIFQKEDGTLEVHEIIE